MLHPPGLNPENIEALSAQELADFRQAIKHAIALNNKLSFVYFEG
jgi:hypothetical protein